MPAAKGSIPWNKGKTKSTSQVVALISKKNTKEKKDKPLRMIVCRGCEQEFHSKRSRKITCDSCAGDKRLYVRLQRYKTTGKKIKELFAERNGLCVLCDRKASDLDHDHETGYLRGVLCHGCNLALSRVEEAGWLEKVRLYLERGKPVHRQKSVI